MKWIVACVLAGATVASAAPDVLPFKPSPAKRKIASEKYSVESLAHFVDAIIADKAGDLHEAESKYRRIKDEHASTAYNLADIKRRLEHYPQAIEFYKKYLELAPDAPDRRDVERLISLIENRPPVAVIDGEDMDAVILVDGKLIGPSPALVQPTKGPHVADRIGPRTYRHQRFSTYASNTEHVKMQYEEAEGNVILSGGPMLLLAGAWEENGTRYLLPGRFTLPPGHYETYVRSDKHACNRIAFDVGKGDDITYVYIDLKPGDSGKFCKDLTAKQQKIRLPK
jgi:tetratricopeptide (TPR) repeat protein